MGMLTLCAAGVPVWTILDPSFSIFLSASLIVYLDLFRFIWSIGKGLQKAKTAAMRVPSKAIGKADIYLEQTCVQTFQMHNTHRIVHTPSLAASPISCKILQQYTPETNQCTGLSYLLQQQEERPSAANKH